MSVEPQRRVVPLVDDFHTHLRQGALCRAVTPYVASGGCRFALVMPNLRPPVTSVDAALAYYKELKGLAPDTDFVMTLYLHPDLTPEEIFKASERAKGIIVGVKSYPRGVTTNSDAGIESYENYYPVFRAMEQVGLVLNLHGEIPSDGNLTDHLTQIFSDIKLCLQLMFAGDIKSVHIMNAEERFLPHLVQLHKDFPKLKIVLEHATSAAAVECVKSLGSNVGCTITLHHLELIVDDWAGQNHHFCKPVAKTPQDRDALRAVVKSGHPRFFLGTDSAPHPRNTKECAIAHAGVFTTPHVLSYLATTFDKLGALDNMVPFACEFGRQFYGIKQPAPGTPGAKRAIIEKKPTRIPSFFEYEDDDGSKKEVVPFYAGREVEWSFIGFADE